MIIKLIAITILITSLICSAEAYTDYEIVIRTIAGEESQCLPGAAAIGCVIRNRAKSQGLTFAKVCLQPYQFSYWLNPRPLSKRELDNAREAWELSENISAHFNFPADHYYNPKLCNPSWAKEMEEVCIIGEHRFMKG